MEKIAKQGRLSQHRSAAVLPEDLVVWDILVRLPAKDILRCRAVCRAWHRRTSAADFLLAHHRRQPSLPLVSSRRSLTNIGIAFDALDLRRRPTERQAVLRCSVHGERDIIRMHASCDGLVLLSLSDMFSLNTGYWYVCNPATHQWIALPSLDDARVAGLYSHSPTGDYRVLFWKPAQQPSATYFNAVYYVLTVGSAEPRCIGQPIAPSSVPIGPTSLYIYGDPPVLLHDCLHWIRLSGLNLDAIVVFDTVDESFRMMHGPPGASRLRGFFWHLLDMDGTLAISWGSEHETVLKLWVLDDYETEEWSLKYWIDFPVLLGMKCGVVEKDPLVDKDPRFSGMVVSEDGDALVHYFCPSSFRLFHLNSEGNVLQTLQWDGLSLRHTVFRFKESLIKHAFFEGPGEGGTSTMEPQFFVGI